MTQGSRPSASSPFLLVEGNLGVPHKVAYRLYMTASTFPRLKDLATMDETAITSIIQKTAIVLLVNPAHQTALNLRKHLIQQGRHSAEKELRLVELLVRGVKVCAKESALWAHRRWCLHFLNGSASVHTDAPLISGSLFSTLAQTPLVPFLSPDEGSLEFAVVRQSVTIYPRNYHAWTHWRYTFDIMCALVAQSPMSSELRHSYSKTIFDEFKELDKWIGAHTSDTSAVHHLLTSLPSMWNLVSSKSLSANICETLGRECTPSKLAGEAWHMLSDFLPYRETSWLYLRSLLGYLSKEERTLYLERMLSLDVPWKTHRKRLLASFSMC